MLFLSDPDLLAAERAIDEVRCGRCIIVKIGRQLRIYASLETTLSSASEWMQAVSGGVRALVLSAERGRALGCNSDVAKGVISLSLPAECSAADALALATAAGAAIPPGVAPATAGDAGDAAVIGLLKTAWLLPAALRCDVHADSMADVRKLMRQRVLHVTTAAALTALLEPLESRVERVSEARIPLADAPEARFICFRTKQASREHVAIIIGAPATSAGVAVRLHSACLTGDVFGSLRCDCGDQLRQSVGCLQALGGGVLLYLAQEGRGIGLANKLRAYALQDGGSDTIDADLQLGFRPDERRYGIAAAMLRALGYERIRLLTNNPDKIEALQAAGITIVERLPLQACITPHNRRYMDAKRQRAHHLLDATGASEIAGSC